MPRFSLLGPVSVRHEGRPVPIRSATRQALLAILLLEDGRAVSVDALVDRLWGEDPPRNARDNLYSYLSRLRSELAPVLTGPMLRRGPGGYALPVDPSTVDVHGFRAGIAAARSAADGEEADRSYAAALGLWRGEPFADLDSMWLAGTRTRLETERHAAELDHHDVRLALGRHGELLGTLTALAEANPLDERIAGQLILALHRSGRSADGLDHYGALRRRLNAEFGNEPGPDLQALHRRILAATGEATVSVTHPGSAAAPPAVRQLPAAPRMFRGRAEVLRALDKALPPVDGGAVLVTGEGGIGKTWLALRWAHDHDRYFPDGQLYVDLRGFDPAEEPVPVTDALQLLLVSLGVAPAAIPAAVDARAALFRGRIAGRRMIVLLDNARDSEQILPLLPGAEGCAVLVTSRNDLAGVSVAHGAPRVSLGPLDPGESYDVLAGHIGRDRAEAEADAVRDILDHCAGLPLALGILAVRAAAHPAFPLAAYAEEIKDGTLDAWDAGAVAANLRAVLDASRRHLSPRELAAFTHLGLAPGPDLGLRAAASLFGAPIGESRALPSALITTGLLREHRPGRFAAHDLTRSYAAELAAVLGEPERPDAIRRLAEYGLHGAVAAERRLAPGRSPIDVAPAGPKVIREEHTDAETAAAWLVAERETLTGLITLTAATGLDGLSWRQTWALGTHFARHGVRRAEEEVIRTGIAAAERTGETAGLLRLLNNLGLVQRNARRFEEAEAHLAKGLRIAVAEKDELAQAHFHIALCACHGDQGALRQAIDHATAAAALFAGLGNGTGHGSALNLIAWHEVLAGEYESAVAHGLEAVEVCRAAGAHRNEGSALDSLGRARYFLGQHDDAVADLTRARDILRELDVPGSLANALDHLADAHAATGDVPAARTALAEAVRLYDDLGFPEAEEARRRLAELG